LALEQRNSDPRLRAHRHHHLVVALQVATGKVAADACYARHTNAEFLRFLKLAAKANPG
jgi:hypothetical protein